MKTSEVQAKAKPRVNTRKQVAPQLVVKSIALTPAANETLSRLMKDGESRVGRKVSASSVVRALLEYCDRKNLDNKVHATIEAELNSGAVIWGRRRTGF